MEVAIGPKEKYSSTINGPPPVSLSDADASKTEDVIGGEAPQTASASETKIIENKEDGKKATEAETNPKAEPVPLPKNT